MTVHNTNTRIDSLGRRAMAACIVVTMFGAAVQPAAAQKVSGKENDLAAAGFIVKPATTSVRQAMLARLPAKKMLQRVNGDVVHYVYADPRGCNCLYVGDQQAYQAYQQQRQAQDLADRADNVAATYSDPAWRWGAWGGGFGNGFRFGRGW